MHNISNRLEAIDHINALRDAYKDAQAACAGLFGPVLEAHKRKVERCRKQLQLAIFCHRENEYEGVY